MTETPISSATRGRELVEAAMPAWREATEVVLEVRALGDEGIALLRTVPEVHLAWLVATRPTPDARRAVLETARLRGVRPGGRAHRLLAEWLEERPSEELFTAALLALKALLPELPADLEEATKKDLVAYLLFLDRAALDVRARRAIVGVTRHTAPRQATHARGAREAVRKEVV